MVRERRHNRRRRGGRPELVACLPKCHLAIDHASLPIRGEEPFRNFEISAEASPTLGALFPFLPCNVKELVASSKRPRLEKTNFIFIDSAVVLHLQALPAPSFLSLHPGGRLTPLYSRPSS